MPDKDFKDIDRLCAWAIVALTISGVCLVISNIILCIYLLSKGV